METDIEGEKGKMVVGKRQKDGKRDISSRTGNGSGQRREGA
jgi:hypothetical protein